MSQNGENQWHLDKRVPLALIVAILAQTGGALFWASAIHWQVGNNLERIAAVEKRQTQIDELKTELKSTFGVLKTQIEWLLADVRDVKQDIKSKNGKNHPPPY